MGLQELFESYDKRKRKSHLKNLLAVAKADGKFKNIEFEYVLQLASKYYMTKKEVERVLDAPEAIKFVPPKTINESFDQLYDLVTVMLVDGEIDDREMTLCKTFALRLGFNPKIIDEMIPFIIGNVLKGIAVNIAIQEFVAKFDY